MTKFKSIKIALLGTALSIGCTFTAYSSNSDCANIARAQQQQICSNVGPGASACAASIPLYNYLYNQCLQNG